MSDKIKILIGDTGTERSSIEGHITRLVKFLRDYVTLNECLKVNSVVPLNEFNKTKQEETYRYLRAMRVHVAVIPTFVRMKPSVYDSLTAEQNNELHGLMDHLNLEYDEGLILVAKLDELMRLSWVEED